MDTLSIALAYPPGAEPPVLKGTLVGPPDDLRIEIRMADLMQMLKAAQEKGGTVEMNSDALGASVARRRAVKAVEPAKKAVTKRNQQRWVAGAPPLSRTQEKAVSDAAGESCVPREGSIFDQILKELAKSPASSLELTERMPSVKSGSIYQACNDLRNRGLIGQEISEHDGTRRWKLAEAKG